MRSIIRVLFVALLPVTSFADDTKSSPDMQIRRPQSLDASRCEEVREVRGMQLCRPAHFELKVRLPDGTVKPVRGEKK